MSKIIWIQLNKLPSQTLFDTFCNGLIDKISDNDEVAFFFTGKTTPDETIKLLKRLKSADIKKVSLFVSLGEEYTNIELNEKSTENLPKIEIEKIFADFGNGNYQIKEDFSDEIKNSYIKQYVDIWKTFFSEDALHHKGTIHYYRYQNSIFALHINTIVSDQNTNQYIVDTNSLHTLMMSEDSKNCEFRIAFGRKKTDSIYPEEEKKAFLELFKNNPAWLFYLCNDNNSNVGCIKCHRKDVDFNTSSSVFYEIILSESETEYVLGYYDSQKHIGTAELYIYNHVINKWTRDENFTRFISEAQGGILYYPKLNNAILKKAALEEIQGIVNDFRQCDYINSPHIRYLQIQNHESFNIYVNCLVNIIEGAINIVNPGSWELLKIPDNTANTFNPYPTLIQQSTEKLFIICFSYEQEYNDITFKRYLEYLKQTYPDLCIYVLMLYFENTHITYSTEKKKLPLHFSNDLETMFDVLFDFLGKDVYRNNIKEFSDMLNIFIPKKSFTQNFNQDIDSVQKTSIIPEDKNNRGENFDK